MKPIQYYSNHVVIVCFLMLFCSCMQNIRANVSEDQLKNESSGKKTLAPYFVVLSDHPETDALPLKQTSASVNLVGVIADVTISQKYVNTGRNTLEAIYTFPMSTRAAVYALEMRIGKRIITAQINEKEKARRDYNQARREGHRASLLEQNRPNVFSMNVANIAAGDTIVVQLKYTELLIPEQGEYTFVYPTVVGPRYSNRKVSEKEAKNSFVSTPYTRQNDLAHYTFNFAMIIKSAVPIQNISCNTHTTKVVYPRRNEAVISLSPKDSREANRDLIIRYSLRGQQIESGVMLYQHADENFFLLMMQPPGRIAKEQIPPREYIFVMDVSGSMNGFPLQISKKLLRNLLYSLRPTDKFNIVLFAGASSVLSSVSIPSTEENIENAMSLFDRQNGGGGTELITALKTAYNIPRENDKVSRTVVLATDGFVDVEKEAFELVRNNNNNSNFFSFGIGSSVNRYLIEGLAAMGNGEPMIVDNSYMAESMAEKFRNYIATPVLSAVKVTYTGIEAYDVEPATIPDMMAERPVIVFGKYKGAPNGKIVVKGWAGDKAFEQSFDVSKTKPAPSNSAIRYLWARERIRILDYYQKANSMNYRSRNSSGETDLKHEITDLGLKYGLMTEYTSFVAIDKAFKVDKSGKQARVKQALPLPEGVSNNAVGQSSLRNSAPSNNQIANTRGVITIADVKGNDEVQGKDIADVKANVVSVREEPTYDVVEQMPVFPGGEAAMLKFISDNLKYPNNEADIQGTVILRFKVNKDGTISNIEVLRSLDPLFDKEAIRVVKLFPRFIPGKQKGVPVAVLYALPIRFQLR